MPIHFDVPSPPKDLVQAQLSKFVKFMGMYGKLTHHPSDSQGIINVHSSKVLASSTFSFGRSDRHARPLLQVVQLLPCFVTATRSTLFLVIGT